METNKQTKGNKMRTTKEQIKRLNKVRIEEHIKNNVERNKEGRTRKEQLKLENTTRIDEFIDNLTNKKGKQYGIK